MAGEHISFFRNRSIDDEISQLVSSGNFYDSMLSIDYFNWDYPGHTFLYWNTKADGSGTIVNPGDKHILLSNYYAIWAENIIYAVNGANLTKVADAIRTKGGTSDSLAFPDGFVSAVNAISTSGGSTSVPAKEVNFRDYDGTVVYSYTPAEFAALTAMPDNPDHSGDEIPLTSQGWNWSFADAQAYVAKYGRLEVGQMYATADGKTHVLIHLEQGRTSPILGCCPNGTVDVDWGDGTAHDTLTGTSVSAVRWTHTHNYAAPGDYDIKLTCSGTMGFYGNSSNNQYCGLLRYSSSADSRNKVYQNAVQAVYCAENTTYISTYAFNSCYSLTSITIPDRVTSINNGAFQYCYSMTHITIPNSMTSINNSAFSSCFSLINVTISDSVTSIGSSAFNNCYNLANITIPDGMTRIDTYTFQNCFSLPNFTIPDSVTSIGTYAFSNCYSLTGITIPDSVTIIDTYVFNGCHTITSIIISDSVTSINANTFSSCYGLTNITIPDRVTSINSSAFSSCYSLTDITIPDSVTSIGTYVFNNCSGLAELHFLPTTPPTVANANAFSYIPADCKIYVPTGSLSAYTTATNYPSSSTYTYIEE